MILSDALSGKSFDEMNRTIYDQRVEEYLSRKLSYISSVKYWKSKKRVKY